MGRARGNGVRQFLASGFGLMVLSAFVYSISDVILKILSRSLPTTEIAFIRFLLGGIILWPILSSMKISPKGNDIRILVLRGIFGTVSFLCLLKSMAMIPLSLAMVLFYTYPIFAALVSFLLIGEEVGKKELALIGIGLVGTYVLINPSSHSFGIGHLFGLFASALGALAMVMIRKARETNGALIIYFYFCLVGGSISFPFFVQNFRMPDLQQGALLVLLGLALLVAQVMMNQGFKYCKAAEGSLFLMFELVFAGTAGVVIFKDPISLRFGLGALLIIGSGLGLNWMNRKP
jgi:drug/metabolite transporter (DMT)-like permease